MASSMSDKLSLNNELAQLDLKNRGFYDELNEEEKKKFSTYLMLKYSASVDASADFQEWYLRATNEKVNINFFDLGKHPKLQWLLCTSVSPGMGKQRHYWQAAKKAEGKNNKIAKFLTKLNPHMKNDEIQLLVELNTEKEIREYARKMGMSDADIKKELG